MGTKECCNISYDTISLREKYIIDISSRSFSSSISHSFLNEQTDSLILSLSNGTILKGKVSSLLKSNPNAISVILSSHSNTITSIDTSSSDNQIVFYTVSLDGVLSKWFYRGDRWSNLQFRMGTEFTFCKLHPKYQNELYVGDRMGTVYVFDVDCNRSIASPSMRAEITPSRWGSLTE